MIELMKNCASIYFFKKHCLSLFKKNPILAHIVYEVFIQGGYAYLVGGYVRGLLNNTHSRDVDIIIDIPSLKLEEIVSAYCTNFSRNRHGGIKMLLNGLSVDMWCLDENWAFKEKLIDYNENNVLESIAAGCFFNYDALVVNMLSGNYNIHHYLDCVQKKTLSILRKSSMYANLNPTVEANILRAFYLKRTQKIQFSSDVSNYIVSKMPTISLDIKEAFSLLIEKLQAYPKYNILTADYMKDEYLSILISQEKTSKEQYLLSYDYLFF